MNKRATRSRWLITALFIPASVIGCSSNSASDAPPLSSAGSGGAATAGTASVAASGGDVSEVSAGAPAQGGAPAARGGAAGSGEQMASAGRGGQLGTNSAGSVGSGGSPASAGSSAIGSAGTAAIGSAGSTAAGSGAPETRPVGYGKATDGGGQTKPSQVKTMAEIQAAIDDYSGAGGLVLEYTGKFDFKTITDPCVQHTLPAQTVEIKAKKDITILGADGSSANFGFHIAGASSNVIIRNMTIALTPGGDASDIVSIEGMSSGMPKNVWIDHNEFYTSMATCAGAGDTAFDGMIDVKKGADNVTVSYNYLHDHHKVSLNGFSDDDDAVRHITFHHNLFENIGSRAPLQRHGFSHLFNNYFLNVSASCVNVRMGGYSLVEANYFENVRNPVTARDSSAIGFWELRQNNLASASDVGPSNRFGITWDAGNSGTVNATAWTTTQAYPEALGYSYQAEPFQCIHDGLRAVVGPGKGLATLKCK